MPEITAKQMDLCRLELKSIKQQTQTVMDRGRSWMEELEEEARKLSKQFYTDDEVLPEAIVTLTRAKIHRLSHTIMHKMRRESATTDDCRRLERLISIHKSQIRKFDPNGSDSCNKFYDEMLTLMLKKIVWQNLLMSKLADQR